MLLAKRLAATHRVSTWGSLAGLAYGQTVLARSVKSAGMEWDPNEAHSAIYDAEMTAMLFCKIVNDVGLAPT